MRVSYIIPESSYEFFWQLVAPLEELGVHVEANQISESSDLVLCGILPQTPGWMHRVRECGKPFILWHWDLYSFVDVKEPRWAEFLDAMPDAVDVWSCGYETARQLKELRGVDSFMMPAWVVKEDLTPLPKEPFAFYAATHHSVGKRVDWAERACCLLGIRLETSSTLGNQRLERSLYLRKIRTCRAYVMSAFEESNGSIPAMEAAAAGAAVVLADLPSSTEVFGRHADYFPAWDFRGLLDKLGGAWKRGPSPELSRRVLDNFDLSGVSLRISRRLHEVHHRWVHPRSRRLA